MATAIFINKDAAMRWVLVTADELIPVETAIDEHEEIA
jgi:hypothetical protein